MSRQITIASLVACSGLACGQSLNLDINLGAGPGAGTPSSSFAGAAGQSGHWDFISPATAGTYSLRGLDGAFNGVTVTRTGSWSGQGTSIGGASADFANLMFDYGYTIGSSNFLGLQFGGLDAGMYRVIVDACMPGSAGTYTDDFGTQYYMSRVSVSVNGLVQGFGEVGGPMQANVFQPGVTHFAGTARVPSDGATLSILSYGDLDAPVGFAAINGVQLVKYSSRIYVDASATGGNTGLDWTNAFTDLQSALSLASASQGLITEVWVANGTYKPTSGADRAISFQVPSSVKLYGGFNGGESSLSQRPMASTILTGNIGAPAAYGDNSYHVVTVPQGATGVVIDGFIIANGTALSSGDNGKGAGLFVNQSAVVTVRNCDFRDHRAIYGGGAYTNLAYVTFADCLFRWNIADASGGLFHQGATTGFIPPYAWVFNCQFYGNHSATAGGAISVIGGDALFAGCVIRDNTAATNGGALLASANGDGAEVTVTSCTIAGNEAAEMGGAFIAGVWGEINVSNSIVWDNRSPSGDCIGGCEQAYWNALGAIVRFDRCILQSASQFLTASSCMDVNPRFVDTDGSNGYSDVRLQPNSLAIDAGSNSLLASDLADLDGDGVSLEQHPLDLDGNPRRVDAPAVPDLGVGAAPVVDMGAHEYVPGPCAADLSGSSDPNDAGYGVADGQVDASDFFYYLDQFTANNMAVADLSGSSDPNDAGYGVPDGQVDASDFFYYLDLFVQGCI